MAKGLSRVEQFVHIVIYLIMFIQFILVIFTEGPYENYGSPTEETKGCDSGFPQWKARDAWLLGLLDAIDVTLW